MEKIKIGGIMQSDGRALVKIMSVPDHASVAGTILAAMGESGINPDVAVITVFGPHLREKPRVHGLMFSSIASVGISSLAISTSISSVSCVVEGQFMETAVKALRDTFDAPFQVKERPKDY
jgi:aspartokinase